MLNIIPNKISLKPNLIVSVITRKKACCLPCFQNEEVLSDWYGCNIYAERWQICTVCTVTSSDNYILEVAYACCRSITCESTCRFIETSPRRLTAYTPCEAVTVYIIPCRYETVAAPACNSAVAVPVTVGAVLITSIAKSLIADIYSPSLTTILIPE